jgi:hypothetical protein
MSSEAVIKHVTPTQKSSRPRLQSNELSFSDRQNFFNLIFPPHVKSTCTANYKIEIVVTSPKPFYSARLFCSLLICLVLRSLARFVCVSIGAKHKFSFRRECSCVFGTIRMWKSPRWCSTTITWGEMQTRNSRRCRDLEQVRKSSSLTMTHFVDTCK